MKKVFLNVGWITLRIVLLVYLGLVGLLFFFQREIIYLPRVFSLDQEMARAQTLEWQPWKTKEGEFIGWQTPPVINAQQKWIFLHGNAATALEMAHWVQCTQQILEPNLIQAYILEYPGFSARAGQPTEKSVRAAVQQGIESLTINQPLYILGVSLGTGAAGWAVHDQRERVRGVVLVTPFDELASAAAYRYPWLPVKWLLQEHYPTAKNLEKFTGRTAVIVAEEDQSVPASAGLSLFASAPEPKHLWLLKEQGHNPAFNEKTPWLVGALQWVTSTNID